MFIRQAGNGKFYVCRCSMGSSTVGKGKHQDKSYRNWFLIKNISRKRNSGIIKLNGIIFPKKFIGKKIRLRVECDEDGI